MEINSDHIIELIQCQSATTQALQDLKSSVEKGFSFVHGEHTKLEDRVGTLDKRLQGVEKKSVWVTGFGAAAGFFSGLFGHKLGL